MRRLVLPLLVPARHRAARGARCCGTTDPTSRCRRHGLAFRQGAIAAGRAVGDWKTTGLRHRALGGEAMWTSQRRPSRNTPQAAPAAGVARDRGKGGCGGGLAATGHSHGRPPQVRPLAQAVPPLAGPVAPSFLHGRAARTDDGAPAWPPLPPLSMRSCICMPVRPTPLTGPPGAVWTARPRAPPEPWLGHHTNASTATAGGAAALGSGGEGT
jgi:hypothetical protein